MAAPIKVDQSVFDVINSTRKRTSYQKRLDALVLMIKDQEMTLPIYQRDISWDLDKSVELLNFQLHGKALISPISIHEFKVEKNHVIQVDFISRNEINLLDRQNETILSLVDGQQRLTTNYKAYINHADFDQIVFDISKGKFRKNTGKTVLRSCIPVGILYNQNESLFEQYLHENGTFHQLYSILIKMRSRWSEYQYTLNIATDMSEKEQIEWFEVLNNAGSRVTDVQIQISKLKLKNDEDFDLYKVFSKVFVDKLMMKFPTMSKLFKPFTTTVSAPIASLNPAYEMIIKNGEHKKNFAPMSSDQKSKLLIRERVEVLNEITELTLLQLDRALDFIERKNLQNNITKRDHILYLVGYFVFLGDNIFTDDKSSKLADWVRTVNFINQSNNARRDIFDDLIKQARA